MAGRVRFVCVLIIAVFTLVDTNQNRRTKLPYIADAVGNSLPPPSSVPATVGSPVSLLTPDRYEFYTFDESGELVKRLMTLEEIQAIVAAGEEADGLVTFANDNKPTIAFNFSQPSHTKVHNVVTNVKNVLKAQMEAHKIKPIVQPTFDTPDVSDSWSLILPSIFGNTGADIVPDKISGSFITPETETIEIDDLNTGFETSESKESNEIPSVSSPEVSENLNKIPETTTSTTISPSTKYTISPTTEQMSTTTKIWTPKLSTKTTNKPKTTSTTSRSPVLLTSTTSLISALSEKESLITANKTTNNITSQNPSVSDDHRHLNRTVIKTNTTRSSTTTIKPIEYEKVSTYSPVSTMDYITEKSKVPNHEKDTVIKNTPNVTNASYNTQTSTTPTVLDKDYKKIYSTTITTQSISPSMSVTSTELNKKGEQENDQPLLNSFESIESQPSLPLFDVAQSISQIASDLGSNFASVPTSHTLLDTTKISNMDIESKENLEIEIPTEAITETTNTLNQSIDSDHFVKISTFDPHDELKEDGSIIKEDEQTTMSSTVAITTVSTEIIDPILSVSMDDLLSQVVHENPDPTTIVPSEKNTKFDFIDATTESKIVIENIGQETTTTDTPTNTNDTPTSDPNMDNSTDIDINKEKIVSKNITTENLSTKSSTYIPETTINSIIEINTTTESTMNDKDLNKYDKLNKTAAPTIYVDFQEKKRIADTKNSSQTMFSTNILLENVLSAPVNVNLSSNKYTTSSTLLSNFNNQPVNLNTNKYDLPKFDEFKKKIQKVNIDDQELATERNTSWKLIPTVPPPKINEVVKNKHKVEGFYIADHNEKDIILEFPKENQGLEVTTNHLGEDILQFTKLCNELAFRYWQILSENVDKKRSIVFSPYSITSTLAMMFMGAKGGTSGEMNEILKLDDMVTFNPHFTLKNISDSIETTSESGVAVSAFVRELFSERRKGKILTFYKERAQHFYNGHVEEINFESISDIIRRRTNLLVKRYTWGKVMEYIKSNSITMNPPLASFSANIFETDCTGTSTDGRDGEIYFVVSPNVRQRRLVPVPAVVYKTNFLAGYDPNLDATAAALGNTNSIISTLFLMPGQQGNVVHADDLEKLEKRLLNSSQSTLLWNGLLRTLLPRIGLELQIPRFSHKSIFNVSSTLKTMGLKEIFDADHADLGGLIGPSKDLYLSDMLQMTTFSTCGEGAISEQHHIEEYPDTLDLSHKHRTSRWLHAWDEPRDYQRAFHDPHDVGDAMHLPLHLRPRQARLPARNSQPARLKFDRPFVFFVRHNPSGMILYVGRYNPRLLP